jgi:hypothetical protein
MRSKLEAEQITPFSALNFHPFAIDQAAFGEDNMDMRFMDQITPSGVNGNNQTNPNSGIEGGNDCLHSFNANAHEFFQQYAFPEEERAQRVVSSAGDMRMRDIEDVFADAVNPVIDMYFAARRTETGFTGKRNIMLKPATREIYLAKPPSGSRQSIIRWTISLT